MASPNLGFSPWRRRAASLSSQRTAENNNPENPLLSPGRNSQMADPRILSSSVSSSHREPIRSFIHGNVRDHLGKHPVTGAYVTPVAHAANRLQTAPVDSAQYARSVREDTAELASYLLSDKKTGQSPAFLSRQRSQSSALARETAVSDDEDGDEDGDEIAHVPSSETIPEVSEPPSPDEDAEGVIEDGPSILTNLLKKSPPQSHRDPSPEPRPEPLALSDPEPKRTLSPDTPRCKPQRSTERVVDEPTERTPLIPRLSSDSFESYDTNGSTDGVDVEGQKQRPRKKWLRGLKDLTVNVEEHLVHGIQIATSPKAWDRRALWQNAVVAPASCLPAVVVGLLLNVLDALSYGESFASYPVDSSDLTRLGMILFPLGKPIFAGLGSAGISIFYVSTIVSQLTFSTGSIFKGGVGSELIEVVPFFHNMAQTITDHIGEDQPDAVIATTIVSYAISSMMTGTVFYLMGRFNFGYMVGFIPRHILIGCIGGVGWFLVATGFEVSARMDGSLEYDMDTLHKLFRSDTIPLWVTPLLLAIVLFYSQTRGASKYFLPLYIISIPVVFYFFVFSLDALEPDSLRDNGWIFEGPPSDEPWWYFYTLYSMSNLVPPPSDAGLCLLLILEFNLVEWDAVLECVPAMLALTFFGILHVPINVPALALQSGEDNADLDRELKLHGYSNFISGMAGSIQNYLVYANTVFFMRSGGDSRLAGYMLAALTFGVMIIGPKIIGFIPIMMVGTLIFDLGFELLLEAVWLPRKKLKLAEYLTVIVIVLVMGIYDFVIGIGVGIILAFVSLIIQTSRVSAVRASYTGEIVGSTVRRNPSQHHYLQEVRRQIYIVKLTGFLFFGTVVSVEEKIRALIDDSAFAERPIKYLILDLYHVTGLDYSAGEAFNTISRLLDNKGIVLVLSGKDAESEVGRNLRAMGLGNDSIEVTLLPDLNSALESCENELLKTLYASQEELRKGSRHAPTANLDVPTKPDRTSFDLVINSPRRNHLHEAARNALANTESSGTKRWQSFKEPLRLMLQIFQGLSDKNEDFWFRAVGYFVRKEYTAGTILFTRGEPAKGFYLVEKGILRADYDLPQGSLTESIVAGTTCGELPFFSETDRTATVTVDRDCVAWRMDKEGWQKLQKDQPDVAQELLRVSLKLTSERMTSITSYILTMAG
ncbi:Putative cyclic nucleotide-binding domain, STAS domain, SLC26A/SulP transporter [Colletotrichum destructivum]|uniref:Cyclic nucleotide-binding domain, STAS domain, SLC26A/SulP transporter n=1 Tax=Colletotrichum destructivum TaxID=34406 RepID=A0AAX4I336_9PEZI|nr:Putative cyclic nucleotide-binding domain, STAS domain, SLC26A/SulP transporter [Colletotrichum destructivum]